MSNDIASLFDNLPELITTKEAEKVTRYEKSTIYDMRYRPEKYRVPKDMFFKPKRKLLIRTKILKEWFMSRPA